MPPFHRKGRADVFIFLIMVCFIVHWFITYV